MQAKRATLPASNSSNRWTQVVNSHLISIISSYPSSNFTNNYNPAFPGTPLLLELRSTSGAGEFFNHHEGVSKTSTFGLKPFSSTDTNYMKTAIMTKLEQLSLSLESENRESENPQCLPLRASIAPELLLLTLSP